MPNGNTNTHTHKNKQSRCQQNKTAENYEAKEKTMPPKHTSELAISPCDNAELPNCQQKIQSKNTMAKFQNKRNHKMQGKFPLSPPQKKDPTKPHAKRQYQRTQKHQSRLAQNKRAENYEDNDKTKKTRKLTMSPCDNAQLPTENPIQKYNGKIPQQTHSKNARQISKK